MCFNFRKIIRYWNIICYKFYGIPSLRKFPYIRNKGLKAVHISAFSFGNSGDLYLPVVLRNLVCNFIPVRKWHDVPVQKEVTDKEVSEFNNFDFILIGGGGLFLTDTHPNNVSGWQWNCSIEFLEKIKSPIIAFAIGYNRFRNQEDFKPIFTEHINKFVEKAAFVGLRNHGSINKINSYLESDKLRKKVVYQPCMTTLTSIIYPTFCNYSKKEDFIAVNCAFDRQDLRSNNELILEAISRVVLELSKISEIQYYSHMQSDKNILPYFDRLGVKYKIIEFRSIGKIIKEYSKPKLVIGMRGHAQMIPFGCNTPILSIVSHDKMQWFLDDIHHPEWGVDVLDPNFETLLLNKAVELYNRTDQIIKEIQIEQKELWKVTQENLAYIKSVIK